MLQRYPDVPNSRILTVDNLLEKQCYIKQFAFQAILVTSYH